jgi:lipoprotein-anchoring transpeptidase ErfK/SrfK
MAFPRKDEDVARFPTSLLKLGGPKIAVVAAGLAVAAVVTASVDRGQDLAPDVKPVAVAKPAAMSKPAAEAKPVERNRYQPVPVDPHALIVKRVLKIDGPFRHGDYAWDETGAPAGRVIITIDLKAQTLSVFRAGYEIGAAVILYGATDKPSPIGAFPITQKDADHVSSLYDAPMPYMLRLTNDGVAIHGSNVKYGSATHGCIGVPTAFAQKLFGVTKLGDLVVITNGKMLDTSKAQVEG